MRAPDRTAPRYKKGFKLINNDNFIRKFKEKYPQYAHYDNKLLRTFLNKHCDKIVEVVATTREGVDLPQGIGSLFVAMVPTSKNKASCIAYPQSIELGTIVRYTNMHTDGRMPKIVYCNFLTKYKYENRALWGFTAVREFKGLVSSLTDKMQNIYITMMFYKKIWQELVKTESSIMKDDCERKTEKTLETYNEFE